MAENFSNLGKEIDIEFHEAQRVPNKMNPKRSTPRHIINMLLKLNYEERILKAGRENKSVSNKGKPIRLAVNFSAEMCRPKESGVIYSTKGKKTYKQEYSIQQANSE